MLKISIINKIEKQIIFEECKIKDQSVKITTIHESSQKILKMNNILTKVFKEVKNIFLIILRAF